MGKMVFVTGGARSGKSSFAIEHAKEKKSVLYIATYRRAGLSARSSGAGDAEMEKRIKAHIKSRPASWKIIEEPVELSQTVGTKAKDFKVVLIDCLTLWVSNLILAKRSEARILKETECLKKVIKREKSLFILVSNEVGMGVVPHTKMGRRFRDIAGKVNQMLSGSADEVYLMISGIPIKIKGKDGGPHP